jgi:bacterioferritin-associated ferredoxin
LDIYRGREYLYREASPLICRCFGVRESDVIDLLKTETDPTLEALSKKTRAGMGCRSCVTQLSRWLAINHPQTKSRFYKDRPVVDWMLDIDSALTKFFEGKDWELEIYSFKGQQVIISFNKEVSQKEEEAMALELQRFLGAEVDGDLGFFLVLIRDLQALKADR